MVRMAYPGVPIALVGHSMGGRVALHLAGEADVVVVAALAPWIAAGGCRAAVSPPLRRRRGATPSPRR